MNSAASCSHQPVDIRNTLRNLNKGNARRFFTSAELFGTACHLNSLNRRKQEGSISSKIFDMRESFGIRSERSEQRKDFGIKNTVQIFRLLLRVLNRSNVNKPFNRKFWKNVCHKTFLLASDNLMSARRNWSKHHLRRKTWNINKARIFCEQTFERGNTNLEEFIKVRGYDRQKLQTLKQRQFFIESLK